MSPANFSSEILLVLASGKEIFGISPTVQTPHRQRGESFFWVRTGHSRLRLGSDSPLFRMVTQSLCTLSPEVCKAPFLSDVATAEGRVRKEQMKTHWAKQPERQRAGNGKDVWH